MLPLVVTVEATGTEEPGKHYSCNLGVSLENEQTKAEDRASVRVEIWMKPEQGILSVETKTNSVVRLMRKGTTNTINFRFVSPNTQKVKRFELSNTGLGLLHGRLFTTSPWLSVSPDLIDIPPSSKATYTLTVATNAMRHSFVDKAFVNILTDGNNDRIPVELSLAPFDLEKTYRAVISIFTLAPIFIASIFHLPHYWNGLLFWLVLSIYLTTIGRFVYWLHYR